MKKYKVLLGAFLFGMALTQGSNTALAQGGDQILDGIGETSMIARYQLNGDGRDWSRNNLHAKYQGAGAKFVSDPRFGNVLSLNGDTSAYLVLPGDALTDLESISISGWFNIRANQVGQHFFDFGRDVDHHFYATPFGTQAQGGFHAAITNGNIGKKGAVASNALELNKWIHVVVVVDIPSKNIVTYIDGRPAGESNEIPAELGDVFGQSADKKILYIGRSLASGNPGLNAQVRDLRIYRVPLSRAQIMGIYSAVQRTGNQGAVNQRRPEEPLPSFKADHPQLYMPYLLSVSNVTVETEVGTLPRLPSFVNGTYRDGLNGPQVRVIWPADMDNSAVRSPGTYTITGKISGSKLEPKATIIVKSAGKPKAPTATLEPFKLSQVSLTNDRQDQKSKFIENRDKFVNTLAKTDPNSFLYMFRHAYGLPHPEGTKPLGVWDSRDTKLRGHATGHYLTAIAQAYASTGYDKSLQENFANKMDYMVNTLYDLSQLSGNPKQPGGPYVADPTAIPMGAGKSEYNSDLTDAGIRNDYWNWGKGFISAYPPDQFIMLEQGAKYGGQLNQIWAPYYTLHKILAGLIDIYEVSNNKKAITIATNMSEWVHARLSQVPRDTLIKMWNTYIAGEFGGMNESLARLYKITGNKKFLATAAFFDNVRLFYGDADHVHGLAKNVDLFRGLHANQHIPQIVGSIQMYDASKNPEYYHVADNFWYKVTNDYMYSIGGVAGARNPSNSECFIAQPNTLYENGFSGGGQNETCATYNMLKLSADLFRFDQRGELMDYYERGLYNHILASVAENTAGNTYHVPIRPGSAKQFGNPNMTGFTCCNGTAIESSTKLQNSIYFRSKDNKAVYINLFVPSTLEWTERKVSIEQTTSFPKEDETRLTIKGNGKFDVNVRVPGWATAGFQVKINGKEEKVNAKPGSYLTINRTWKSGDVIELKMPFQFHLSPVMDQQNIASLFYGPIQLAAQETEARNEWRKVTLDAKDISKSIKGDPSKLEFTIGDVVFKPFYQTYGRHSVYLDVELK